MTTQTLNHTTAAALWRTLSEADGIMAQNLALDALDLPSGAWARLHTDTIARVGHLGHDDAWSASLVLHA